MRDFLAVAETVYADDPHWIPEDPGAVAALASRAPMFCVPGAARAALFPGPDPDSALFGLFESTGDDEAEAYVMERLQAAAVQRGARRLFGPIDGSTALGNRIRLHRPRAAAPYVGEPYNPERYAAALEHLGLDVVRRYVSHDMDAADIAALAGAAHTSAHRLERLDSGAWHAHADELFVLTNAVFAGNFAFRPLTRAQFDALPFAERIDPELSVLAFGPAGEVAGVILVFPHYGPLVVAGAGEERVSLDALSYAEHGPLVRGEAVLKTGGVAPAHRRSGLARAMTVEVARRCAARGEHRLLIGPMREDNPSRLLFGHGHREQRWYGLYTKDL